MWRVGAVGKGKGKEARLKIWNLSLIDGGLEVRMQDNLVLRDDKGVMLRAR
jgi:hypothetical protein